MKKEELRVGNVLNYKIEKGEFMPTHIDWQDLKWVSEDRNDFNLAHKPILLTEKILLKCGFKKKAEWHTPVSYYYRGMQININDGTFRDIDTGIKLTSLHQLQNLYFELTNEELIINL